MGRLERKYLAHYIDATMGEGQTRSYVRLGKDLETYSEELNPQVNVQRDIKGNPNVVITGYQVQSDADTYYAEPTDPLFAPLTNIANNRLTDDKCKTTKIDVLFDSDGTQIYAFREVCYIVPNSVGGDTSGVQIPFTVYCGGDREYGTFNITSREFTPSEEPYNPQPSGGIIPLHASYNGTYSAPEGYAYNPVYVNVPPEATGLEAEIITRVISGVYSNSVISMIGEYAFWSCNDLIGASVDACLEISSYAFAYCGSLSSVYAPSCQHIRGGAFSSCSKLQYASFPQCVSVQASAFMACPSLSYASFPLCEYIGIYAFQSCKSMTSIYFPKVSSVNAYAFYTCSRITSVDMPSCVFVGSSTFNGCGSIEYVSMPLVKTIGQYGFAACINLQSIELPECTMVSSSAFQRCTGLSSVSLPKCGNIYGYAFLSCYNLINLYVASYSTAWTTSICALQNSTAFNSTPIGGYSESAGMYGSIYVPSSLLATYQSATNWALFSDRFVGV